MSIVQRLLFMCYKHYVFQYADLMSKWDQFLFVSDFVTAKVSVIVAVQGNTEQRGKARGVLRTEECRDHCSVSLFQLPEDIEVHNVESEAVERTQHFMQHLALLMLCPVPLPSF